MINEQIDRLQHDRREIPHGRRANDNNELFKLMLLVTHLLAFVLGLVAPIIAQIASMLIGE